MKNIDDVMDKLEELPGNLEDMIDALYDVNGIVYGLRVYLVTFATPKLKNLIGGFNKMREMERELGGKFGEFQNLALSLRDALVDEKLEGTGEMTNDAKKTAYELFDRLSELSCELDELSSRASWLEDKADTVRYELMELCGITDIDIIEEEDGNK